MRTKEKTNSGTLTLKSVLTVVLCAVLLMSMLVGCVSVSETSTEGDESSSDEGTSSGAGFMIVYLVVIVAVFYFLMIRPEKKRKKKAEEMRNSIAIGDNVTTIGGMVGKVVNISDEYITFETGEDRVRVKIAKWGISSTGKDTSEPDEKAGN